eukprot:m.35963 g.35963  ORF g.35963 m.35963 type:complete len:480 (+) comp5346_c0_seq1:243-1682(+)
MEREDSVLGCTAWVKRRLNGPWSAATVGHQLTPATLDNLAECFSGLDSAIKTRVMLGILSLRRRDIDRLAPHIHPLLARANEDTDDWVKTICALAHQYVSDGVISPALARESSTFKKWVESIEAGAQQSNVLPMSVRYLNDPIRQTLSAVQSAKDMDDKTHFKLKRQPTRIPRVAEDVAPGTTALKLNSLAVDSRHGSGLGLATSQPRRATSTADKSKPQAKSRRAFLESRGFEVGPIPQANAGGETDGGPAEGDHIDRKRKATGDDEEVADHDHDDKRMVAEPDASATVQPSDDYAAPSGEHLYTAGTDHVNSAATEMYSALPDTATSPGYQAEAPSETTDASAASGGPTATDGSTQDGAPSATPSTGGTTTTQGQPSSEPPTAGAPSTDAPALTEQLSASVFAQTNRLQPSDRARIEAFMAKTAVLGPNEKDVQQIVLHEERTPGSGGNVLVEQLVFEMTFSTMEWRRLRRRRTIRA